MAGGKGETKCLLTTKTACPQTAAQPTTAWAVCPQAKKKYRKKKPMTMAIVMPCKIADTLMARG